MISTQAGNLFRMMSKNEQERLCANIASTLHTIPERIQKLQISHFAKCDSAYSSGVDAAIERALGSFNRKEPVAEMAHA